MSNPTAIDGADLEDEKFLSALIPLPQVAGQNGLADWIRYPGQAGDDSSEPGTCAGGLATDLGMFHLMPNGDIEGLYNDLARDSWLARDAIARIRRLVPNPDSHMAVGQGYYWEAFIMANRADAFEQITFNAGPPHTPVEVYAMALDRLADAVAVLRAAGGNATYEAAAYGTMARVERQLFFETGQAAFLASAAQHAAQALAAQSTFRLEAVFGGSGQQNSLYQELGLGRGFAIRCGALGLAHLNLIDPVSNQRDPRVVYTDLIGIGPNNLPVYYSKNKYPTASSPIPVSRWQEARLIIAENHLHTGDLPGAVSEINQVRAAASLPAFQSADPAAIRQQLIYERKAEFWLEGRGFPDLRNYQIFPMNWNEVARALGVNRRFPVSDREKITNPNL